MKIEGDNIVFSSGKTRSANRAIIGLSPDLEITGGYDDGFYNPEFETEEYKEPEDLLSKSDLIELADHMIEQWIKFKEKIA